VKFRFPGRRYILLAAFPVVGLLLYARLHTQRREAALVITPAPKLPRAVVAADPCARRIKQLLSLPTLTGTPTLDRARSEILARAKASPVVFLREPANTSSSTTVQQLRTLLTTAPLPWEAFETVLKKASRRPKLLRQVLLTDGYLYADSPALAVLISSGISLTQLFDEPELWITRGNVTAKVTKKKDEYFWAEGADQGKPAKLWLFDRVELTPNTRASDCHVTVDEVRKELGARAVRIERLTEEGIVANVEYGDLTIPTVLTRRGNRAVFECESVSDEARARLTEERSLLRRRYAVLQRLQRVVDAQVDEALPFDEPKTEEGQQDGKLRHEWQTAYRNGARTFTFNGDSYPVFDAKGRPHTPQVCVDFITDSWDRMADTHWLSRDDERRRQVGRLDFDGLEVENRRSVESLFTFAGQHPNWFELLVIPEVDRIPFSNRRGFFERLGTMYREFAPGDVVAILGPRDDERLHYHSFFIVADDPVTAIPTWVAANAGRPRIRTWEGEMQNAPRRALFGRIRPTLAWLESIAGLAPNEPKLGALQ
jgi:hypothetical protein